MYDADLGRSQFVYFDYEMVQLRTFLKRRAPALETCGGSGEANREITQKKRADTEICRSYPPNSMFSAVQKCKQGIQIFSFLVFIK